MYFKKTVLILGLVIILRGVCPAQDTGFFLTSKGKKVKVIKDHILVKFKPRTTARVKDGIFKEMGAWRTGKIHSLGIERIKIKPGRNMKDMLERLSKRKEVEFAEPIYIYSACRLPGEYSSVDDMAYRQWGLAKIDAAEGWDIETGTQVIVAILDSGVDLDHYELDANIWDNPDKGTVSGSYTGLDSGSYTIQYDTHGWDFVNNNNSPDDDYGHGTHVSGIVGAGTEISTYGVVGMSWDNKLMAVKVLDSAGDGNSYDIALGINYAADRGARVLNMSFGGEDSAEAVREAVDYAHGRGCVLVAASGNGGQSSIYYPAAFENVIAVGATRSSPSP